MYSHFQIFVVAKGSHLWAARDFADERLEDPAFLIFPLGMNRWIIVQLPRLRLAPESD